MIKDLEAFVTIFDKNFLPQALLMHESLVANFENAFLYMVCMDNFSFNYLKKLELERVTPIALSDIENDDLLKVKDSRSSGEYAWTLTPFLPSYIFKLNSKIERVTYVDADLWFLKSPEKIINSFIESEKDFLLTPHDFESNQDLSNTVGTYCVQFMTFTRKATDFLIWWQKKCLDWCFAYIEKDRFGDQKYLDEVPTLFPGKFLELKETHLLQGPWNVNKFRPKDAVAYHFHGLRIRNKIIVRDGIRHIKLKSHSFFYDRYIALLFEIIESFSRRGLYLTQLKSSTNYNNRFFSINQIKKMYRVYLLRNLRFYQN